VTLGSALLGLVGASVSLFLGLSPFTREPWLDTGGIEAVFVSLLLGGCIAGITILSSRFVVRRFQWARALHGALRPAFADQRDGALVLMAVASGIGEELFFRGLLSPLIGIVLSSLAFGVLHQVRGSGRWAWAAWATLLGASLALVYALTGQLIGPIVAHVAINAANLRYLRDTSVDPQRPRRLGGLLNRV
jgi:membrane protease YdiL (CAAX protease family)